MEKIARRKFCGAAIMAFPLMGLQARESKTDHSQNDTVLDVLADEVARITHDGAQKGFRAEHFRRYAGVIRAFDAHMEDKGVNRELNQRLDEDDLYNKIDPVALAQATMDYWEKKGLRFNKNDLVSRLATTPRYSLQIKRAIKNQGGVRALNRAFADAIELKAREFEKTALRGGPLIYNGIVTFAQSSSLRQAEFMYVQDDFDFGIFIGRELDCFCAAINVQAGILWILCLAGFAPACAPAAWLTAILMIMEGLRMCDSSKC